jgi:hypothetical protein
MLRRHQASGMKPWRFALHILQFSYCFRYEKVHPLQSGFFRRKVRRQRRPDLPIENPLVFYPRRIAESLYCHAMLLWTLIRLRRMHWRIRRDPKASEYMDRALAPIQEHEEEIYEILKAAVPSNRVAVSAR